MSFDVAVSDLYGVTVGAKFDVVQAQAGEVLRDARGGWEAASSRWRDNEMVWG